MGQANRPDSQKSFSCFAATLQDLLLIQDAEEIVHRRCHVWIGQFFTEPIGTILNWRVKEIYQVCQHSATSFADDCFGGG
jgi:hypothetical protein